MGKIKEAWQSLRNQNKHHVGVEDRDLWTAVEEEIEALKARVERLEDGATDDGK